MTPSVSMLANRRHPSLRMRRHYTRDQDRQGNGQKVALRRFTGLPPRIVPIEPDQSPHRLLGGRSSQPLLRLFGKVLVLPPAAEAAATAERLALVGLRSATSAHPIVPEGVGLHVGQRRTQRRG